MHARQKTTAVIFILMKSKKVKGREKDKLSYAELKKQ